MASFGHCGGERARLRARLKGEQRQERVRRRGLNLAEHLLLVEPGGRAELRGGRRLVGEPVRVHADLVVGRLGDERLAVHVGDLGALREGGHRRQPVARREAGVDVRGRPVDGPLAAGRGQPELPGVGPLLPGLRQVHGRLELGHRRGPVLGDGLQREERVRRVDVGVGGGELGRDLVGAAVGERGRLRVAGPAASRAGTPARPARPTPRCRSRSAKPKPNAADDERENGGHLLLAGEPALPRRLLAMPAAARSRRPARRRRRVRGRLLDTRSARRHRAARPFRRIRKSRCDGVSRPRHRRQA